MSQDFVPPPSAGTPPGAARGSPPPSGRLTVERFEDGLTVRVAPLGMTSGLLGMFVGGIICELVGTFPLVAAAIQWATGWGKVATSDLVGGMLFFVVLGGVGLALILASLNMARRQAALAVTGGVLMALQTGLFGNKQREWAPGEVLAIRIGPSGLEINKKPVMELQVVDNHGRKFSMLAGHPDEDLHWLAGELRQALGLSAQAARGSPGQAEAIGDDPDDEGDEDIAEDDWGDVRR